MGGCGLGGSPEDEDETLVAEESSEAVLCSPSPLRGRPPSEGDLAVRGSVLNTNNSLVQGSTRSTQIASLVKSYG